MFVDFRMDFEQDGLNGWISLELIFSGCKKAMSGNPCKGCHNPELWEFKNIGTWKNPRKALAEKLEIWKSKDVKFDGIVLLGGEPVDQDPNEVVSLLELVHEYNPNLPVMLYIGYDSLSEIPPESERILKQCSFVKIGGYKEEIPARENSRLASGNQRVYRCDQGVLKEEIEF